MKQKSHKVKSAEKYNVSVDEAVKRLRLQNDAGKLQAVLMEKLPDDFAGAWIEHEPEYKIVVALVSGDETVVKSYFMNGVLDGFVEVIKADRSYEELRAQQGEASDKIKQLGIQFDAGIDVHGGWVEIYVTNETELNQALQITNNSLPNRVKIIVVDAVGIKDQADIFGGLNIVDCTTGFSVLHNSGGLYTTTAGHCDDPPDVILQYFGTTLSVVDSTNAGSADIAYLNPGPHTPRNLYNVNGSNAPVYEVRHWNEQMEDQFVCHMTRGTTPASYICGNIIDRTFQPLGFNPTWIRVSAGTDLSVNHDSGSAWTASNVGYGFHKAEPDAAPDDAIYMPQNFADALDLCVLRGPAGDPAPITTGSLNGSFLKLSWISLGVCGYEIHREQNPYFTASTSNLVATLFETSVAYSNNLGVGDPNNNYYYNINTITGSPTNSSQNVGEFDFAIVPGN